MTIDLSLVILIICGLVAVLGVLVIHRRLPATVTGFHWVRTIDIEHEHWVKRTSYWGYPSNSRNRSSRQVNYWETVTRWETKQEYIFGRWQTRSVPVHRQELRRRTEYSYEIPKRRYSHTISASGNDRQNVKWPVVDGGYAGRQTERYTATFEGVDGKRHTSSLSAKRWHALEENEECQLAMSWYGWIMKVRPTEHVKQSRGSGTK